MKKGMINFDRSTVSQAVRTPQGYLKAPVAATRVGVFSYRLADGSMLNQLRCPEEVFKDESLASLAGVPVTDDHPSVPLLTAENTRMFQRGYTGEQVDHDDTNVLTSLTVTDSELIAKIDADGKTQVSCGYTCDLEEAPGLWNGIPYDVIQRNIIYNHLAVVDQGRAGPTIKIQLDSVDAANVAIQDAELASQPEGDPMNEKEITLGGKTFKLKAEIADAIEAQMKINADAAQASAEKATAAEAAKLAAEKARDQAQAQHDAAASELEKTKKAHQDAASVDVPKLVRERMRIEAVARKVMADSAQIDSMSDLEVKKAVIVADSKNANLDGKSEDYVNARFDSIVERQNSDDAEAKKIAENLSRGRGTNQDSGEVVNADDARKRSMERSKEAYKQPLAATAKNK